MSKKKPTPIELLREQYDQFKRTGEFKPTAYRLVTCYVCHRKSPIDDMVYVGKDREGVDVYRHEQCGVGSASWLKHAPKDNKWRKYFTSTTDGDQ